MGALGQVVPGSGPDLYWGLRIESSLDGGSGSDVPNPEWFSWETRPGTRPRESPGTTWRHLSQWLLWVRLSEGHPGGLGWGQVRPALQPRLRTQERPHGPQCHSALGGGRGEQGLRVNTGNNEWAPGVPKQPW